MYIAAAWSVAPEGIPDEVQKRIVQVVETIGDSNGRFFTNVYSPFPGHVLANVHVKRTESAVDRLHAKLLPLSGTLRFEYTLCAVTRNRYIRRSKQVNGARCDTISQYGP